MYQLQPTQRLSCTVDIAYRETEWDGEAIAETNDDIPGEPRMSTKLSSTSEVILDIRAVRDRAAGAKLELTLRYQGLSGSVHLHL